MVYRVVVEDEGFYEVGVVVTQTRSSCVYVHLRANSTAEAGRRAVDAVRDLNPSTSHDLKVDDFYWEEEGVEVDGVEEITLVKHGCRPSTDDPLLDLLDLPPETAKPSPVTDRQLALPL